MLFSLLFLFSNLRLNPVLRLVYLVVVVSTLILFGGIVAIVVFLFAPCCLRCWFYLEAAERTWQRQQFYLELFQGMLVLFGGCVELAH